MPLPPCHIPRQVRCPHAICHANTLTTSMPSCQYFCDSAIALMPCNDASMAEFLYKRMLTWCQMASVQVLETPCSCPQHHATLYIGSNSHGPLPTFVKLLRRQ
eukprot:scaffold150349_cov24-Tisochrysis_lutea.AAC.1